MPGPNLFSARQAAILDVAGPPEEVARVVTAWRGEVRRFLEAVGWGGESIATREFAGGANLVLTAPLDALYAATEVNEAAFAAARAAVGLAATETTPAESAGPDFVADVERLRAAIAKESNPRLIALRDACEEHGVAFVPDEKCVSIGLGKGSRSFDPAELPAPASIASSIDWPALHDVPVCLVTGTNGKSTTVRVLAVMARAAGKVAGYSSTDGVRVGDELVEKGDYSGPSGARLVVRDPRVEVAILETARGGLLRRGLVLRRVDAAAVLNVSEDHLGEFGVASMDDLVDAKLVVRRAVERRGTLVLNAEDPRLVARAERFAAEADDEPAFARSIAWFSRDPALPLVQRHLSAGGMAAVVEGGELVLYRGAAASAAGRGSRRESLLPLADAPITLGGAARHNVANLLAATLLGAQLGFDAAALAGGMRAFRGSSAENPGRGNVVTIGGVTLIVDFAHNPDSVKAMLELAQALPAKRRLLVIGQAGDRDDHAIAEFARAAAAYRPDRIVIKEMTKYLRGREPGVIPALLEREFLAAGIAPDAIVRTGSELEALDHALSWARRGDLLLLLTHAERARVLKRLAEMERDGWEPPL